MPKKHVYCDNPYIPMGGICKENGCVKCNWMEEPSCHYCHDTGDLGQGFLDCGHCDAASIIGKYQVLKEQGQVRA